jgi:lipoprotein-anchoring transpeptidase ErfK/SrfK
MIALARRSLSRAAVCAALLGLAACASTARVPQPAALPPVGADSALNDFRNDLQADNENASAVNDAAASEAARRHVEDILSNDVINEYELFIFINKAGEGPMAQHAYLFTKDGSGNLQHLDTWLVSTGREQQETSPKGAHKFTSTPTGTFMFDVNHFSRLHKSNAWEADMPWAMFLKTRNGGPTSGIALHAALDKYVHNLGQRASAGCIRLLPSNAEKLFKLLKSGIGARLGGGSSNGAKALVIIENADGAALMARYGSSGPSASLSP